MPQDLALSENIPNGGAAPDSLYLRSKADETSALRKAILDTDGPVFAVLDGAKFDDLPNALLRARLVNRPLYSDRGGQVRDFDLTSPQLVYLDRTRDSETKSGDGDCNARVVDDLFGLLDECSAAVFWTCVKGGDALFSHLRKINLIRIPSESLPTEGRNTEKSGGDEVLLFRHADANVMAQILPVLQPEALSHVLGPAEAIRFVPDIVWSLEERYEFRRASNGGGLRPAGMLRFDETTMQAVEERRSIGVLRHLLIEFYDHHRRLGEGYQAIIEDAHRRATAYGIETFEDFELFARTECEYGPRFEYRAGHEEARYMLAEADKSPTERVYYARRACLDAAGDDR